MYRFDYKGGSDKSTGDKFYALFVLNGDEEFVTSLSQSGIVYHPQIATATFQYETSLMVAKVFMAIEAYGSKIIQSFFIRLSDVEDSDEITIRHFNNANWYFTAKGNFIPTKEAISLLNPNSPSLVWLKRQRRLPVETLRRIVSIKRAEPEFEGRVIAVGYQE